MNISTETSQCELTSSTPTPGNPDHIEDATLQIFTHIYSFIDGMDRSEVENAIVKNKDDLSLNLKSKLSQPQATYVWNEKDSHRFRPFKRETNFYRSAFDHSIHTQQVLCNLFSAITKLFLGIELFTASQSVKTPEKMRELLRIDDVKWKNTLKEHYHSQFWKKMDFLFFKTDQLLISREKNEKQVYRQRLTLYASLIITIVGKILSQKVIIVGGVALSSITFLFMVIHYGTVCFKNSHQATDLKLSVDRVYKETADQRLKAP